MHSSVLTICPVYVHLNVCILFTFKISFKFVAQIFSCNVEGHSYINFKSDVNMNLRGSCSSNLGSFQVKAPALAETFYEKFIVWFYVLIISNSSL